MDHFSSTVTEAARLDKSLAENISDVSRSRIKQLIEAGHASLNGETITNPAVKVKPDDMLELTVPAVTPTDLTPSAMELDILFEDSHLLVLNKPSGLTVHPGAGTKSDTLVHGLLAHCGDSLSGIGGVERPGIVHRLDKETSGLMVVAKNDAAHQHLSTQLQERTLKRRYAALCWGVPQPMQGTWEGAIARSPRDRKRMAVVEGGKEARTHYVVDNVFQSGKVSLLSLELETGRTHQIRVHSTYHGYPLLGDHTYGGRNQKSRLHSLEKPAQDAVKSFKRQALHAERIRFIHPVTGKEKKFRADWPADLTHLAETLAGG